MAAFDYAPIRATAIGLVKQFGNNVTQCILLRNTNVQPADPNKPWRGDDPVIKQFKFIGVESTYHLPADTDGDKKVIVPGDITTTPAEGDPSVLCGYPLLTDRIQLPSGVYAIIPPIVPVEGAGVPIIFKLRCRAWPYNLTAQSTPF